MHPLVLYFHWPLNEHNAHLIGEVRSQPEIVIAPHTVDVRPGGNKIVQREKDLRSTARNYCAVFKPEVKEVSDDIQPLRSSPEPSDPYAEPSFLLLFNIWFLTPQMDIRDKKDPVLHGLTTVPAHEERIAATYIFMRTSLTTYY